MGSAIAMARRKGIIGMGGPKLWSAAGYALAPFVISRFAKEARDVRGIERSLDFALSHEFIGALIAPMQVREEIQELLRLVDSLKPRTVLEIGTANGGTLFLFTRFAASDAELMSIDLPWGRFGGGYSAWRSDLYVNRSFALGEQRIRLIRKDSHSTESLSEVRTMLDGRSVDFLFIDGDHSYEGVRRDFEMYSPLVREGGMIAFHDICPGPQRLVGGVPRFWSEIREGRDIKELVKDPKQGGYGIGVIFVSSRANGHVLHGRFMPKP